jgi:hypothetical protein
LLNNAHSPLNSFSIEANNTCIILGEIIDGIQCRPIVHVC